MNYHPLTYLAQYSQTFVFAFVNIFAAVLLWTTAPGRRRGGAPSVWMRTLFPAVAILMIFFQAYQSSIADRALMEISTLRIPLASLASSEESASDDDDVYFVVGDQLEGSDLVVAPYPDEVRSRQVLGPDPRPLLTVRAARDGSKIASEICLYAYPADETTALPGMLARTATTNIESEFPQERECQPLRSGDDPQTIMISRVDSFNDVLKEQPRRELTIKRRGEGIQSAVIVRLVSPLKVDMGNCTRPNARLMPKLALPSDPEYLPADNLVIPQLGTGGAHPLLVPTALGEQIADGRICDAPQFEFRWPTKDVQGERLSGTITRTFLPWFPVILVLVSSLILYGFFGRSWNKGGAAEGIVFALQWLLLLRIIIGVGGLYAQPAQNAATVMWDISLAYVCIPIIAAVLLMRRDAQTAKNIGGLSQYLGLVVIAIGLWQIISIGGGLVPSWRALLVPLSIITLTALILGARAVNEHEAPLLQQLWDAPAARSLRGDPWQFGIKLLILAIAIRIALVIIALGLSMFGIESKLSESIGPLRLSLLYVPATIIGIAALLAGFRREPSTIRMAVLIIMFAIAYVLVAIFVRDFGIVFVFAWPVGAAIAAFGLGAAIRRRRFVAAAGITLPLMAPLSLFLLAWYWGQAEIPHPNSEGGLVAHIEAVKDWDDNYVRLLRFARPDRVEELGTKSAFNTLDQAASLDPLGRELVGNGYLVSANVRDPLIRYQYTDNLSAIHIMWPFGRIGVIALLIFLYMFADSFRPPPTPAEEQGSETDMRALVGHMATATLLWAGIYMTLANLNLVPFTGRNIYLLAVTSGSDILEGLMLILLAALPWLPRASSAQFESTAR